ncbi:MAG: ribbon-helix-helix protein, CopG family [bacterium]|nr:ribbon-helix-helix protein, CopG family [bacterium]
MSTTLTVRTGEELRQALDRRARALGKSVSELVRDILEEAVVERPISERAGHLKGRLSLPAPDDKWRRQIKKRNWRP